MRAENKTPDKLIGILCAERGELPPRLREEDKADYFRALCNVRPPLPVSETFLHLQDEYLSERTAARGVADVNGFSYRNGVCLWQGDITRLNADAIVNACNADLLGCFHPLHGCIDNAIHSNAGVQVRLECNAMMQGGREPNGRVRVTKAYNLPCRLIFHTVGPIVRGEPTAQNERDLKNCYLSCLNEAEKRKLSSLAFCCISTGEYGYPKDKACAAAVQTVRAWQNETKSSLKIIFDVFTNEDKELYERELRREPH